MGSFAVDNHDCLFSCHFFATLVSVTICRTYQKRIFCKICNAQRVIFSALSQLSQREIPLTAKESKMYNTGMGNKILRVYVDNSVVSGMFDDHIPERVEQTGRFWQAVIDGKFQAIASDILRGEMERAPQHVRDFFSRLPESQIERAVATKVSDDLAAQYIGAKIISENHLTDCRHIALATVINADAVVSWNCGDLVNPNRIPKYHEVNKERGYPKIAILTPDKFMEAHYDET